MNRTLISIGPINIYYYSVTMLLAILTGSYVAYKESKRIGMDKYLEDLLFPLIIFGIIGARLYYVIFNFELYQSNILSIFKIWEGGLAIYGGIIGGFIAIVCQSKKYHQNILKTTDILTPGLILAQSIGRWGNFFNSEAHGAAVTLEYLQKRHIPDFIIQGMYIDGKYYQPTFLYESIWCLLGFIVMIIIRSIIRKKEKDHSQSIGTITFMYFIWYGLGRLYIESMRTDSLYLGTIRVSQLVSVILIILGIIGYVYILKMNNNKKEGKNYAKKI